MKLTIVKEEMQTWLIKPAFIPIASRTPSSTVTPACQANSSIDSENSTGGSLTFNLYGNSSFISGLDPVVPL